MTGTALLVLLQIAGAAALLLWAVRLVRTGVTRAFGARLRGLVTAALGSRPRALASGLLVTLAFQSATATALLLASLARHGLVATPAAIAVLMGADVGSTLSAQLFARLPAALLPLPLVAGVVLYLRHDSGLPRHIGRILTGLALVLLALDRLRAWSAPVRDSPELALLLELAAGDPAVLALLVAGLTWLLHSSLAAVLLLASLAAHGLLEGPAALAAVVGANVGGSLPALVLTAGARAEARRAVAANLLLRAAAGIALLAFAAPVSRMLEPWLPPGPDAILHLHTAFNLLVAAVGLLVSGPLARLLTRLVPERIVAEDPGAPRHLDPGAVDEPAVALGSAAREALRMGEVARSMLVDSLEALARNDLALVREIRARDDILDSLHEAIKFYLLRVARRELDEKESRRHQEILNFITNMEHIGDIVDLNLMETAEKKARENLKFSPQGFEELRRIHRRVVENMDIALAIFTEHDVELARRLVAAKAELRELEREAWRNHLRRLALGVPDTVATTALHLDVIRDLKRINSHITAIAYPVLEEAGGLRPTRLAEEPEPLESPAD